MQKSSKIVTGILLVLIAFAIFVIYILRGTDTELEDDVLGFGARTAYAQSIINE